MLPPEENTAADPTGASWVVWLVIAGPGLLFVALTCVRRAGPDELVVVVRRGLVVRSRRSGLVARWPVVERFAPLPTGPRVLPLVVRSRTRDDVDVVALADLVVEVGALATGTAYVPTTEVVRRAEDAVAGTIAGIEVGSLVDELDALEPLWPEDLARLLPVGTRATALTVTEVQARLTGGAA